MRYQLALARHVFVKLLNAAKGCKARATRKSMPSGSLQVFGNQK
jgi:hypothetical protein